MSPRVLLVGGSSRVGRFMIPKMTSLGWHVITTVRSPAREQEMLDLATGGSIEVLFQDLELLKTPADAQKVLDAANPDWVMWVAGGNEDATPDQIHNVDVLAAQAFIKASLATASVKKYMHVTYLQCRFGSPSWWDDKDVKDAAVLNKIISEFHAPRHSTDMFFTAMCEVKRREGAEFQGILFRPGVLLDRPATGRINMVKARAAGSVTRDDTAQVAVDLIARGDTNGWFELENGDKAIAGAIDEVVETGFDASEGEFESLEALLASQGM